MSILNFAATVLTRYKADVSDHKEALKTLSGEERKLAEQRMKHAEQHNAAIDGAVKRLASWQNMIGEAEQLLAQGVERTRLTAAAGYANIEALRTASAGLVRETDLLRFAAVARSGALKADTELTEAALRAMRTLTQQGHEYTKVSEKITEALVKGEGEGLKDLGVTIRKTTSDADRMAAVKEKILELANASKAATDSEATSMQAASVAYQDSMDKVRESLGRIALALGPVVELAAKLAEAAAKVVSALGNTQEDDLAAFEARLGGKISDEEYGRRRGFTDLGSEVTLVGSREGPPGGVVAASRDNYLEEALKRQAAREEAERRKFGAAAARSASPSVRLGRMTEAELALAMARAIADNDQRAATDRVVSDLESQLAPQRDYGLPDEAALRGVIDRIAANDNRASRANDRWNRELTARRGGAGGAGAGIRAAQESELAKVFGPLSDFNAYKTAFDALGGAVGSALGAWIDGSQSAGEAFKAFIGEALKGTAVQLSIEALKHGAFAIGALAFGDIAGAAVHGKAAVAFAAGAAAAAVAAKELGGGGSAAPAPGGGGAGGAAGASSPRGTLAPPTLPEGRHQIIVVGNSWGRQSPRAQALEAEEIVAMSGAA